MHRVTKDETENEKIGFSWPILKAIWVQYSSIFFLLLNIFRTFLIKFLSSGKNFMLFGVDLGLLLKKWSKGSFLYFLCMVDLNIDQYSWRTRAKNLIQSVFWYGETEKIGLVPICWPVRFRIGESLEKTTFKAFFSKKP